MNSKNLIANPIVVLRKEFDDWAVLFNPDTAEAVGVNPVGVAIWEKLNGKNTIAASAQYQCSFPGLCQILPDSH